MWTTCSARCAARRSRSAFTCTRHLPTCDGRATMDMQANTPPDFTPKTDRDDLDLPAEQVVVAYHERTKHHYHRYAAALARIAKMKDGRTHLAHKAEHAVDLDSGAVVAVTLQAADKGDT